MKSFKQALFATVVGSAFALAAGSAMADVIIGVGGPLTGPNAAFGDQYKRGVEQAVADLNAKGGVNGEKIRIVYGDDASDPRQGVAVANKMVSDKAVFVAGHFNSSVSIPASEVYADAGILQITPSSTNPKLTEQGFKTVFRTCGRDDQQGDIAGAYLAQHFKDKEIAILHDQTTYGKGLADATKAAMNKAGAKEKIYEGVTVGERDFSALISKLKQAGVDVIYFGGLHNEAGLIIRQAKEQGMNTMLMSGDGIVTEEFWSITGPAGEGTLMTFGRDPRNLPYAKETVAAFEKSGQNPEGYTLNAYAAVQVWAEGAKRAKTFDGLKVAEAIRQAPIETVLGPLSFDAKGDRTVADYVFYTWSNGKYVEMK